MSRTPGARNIGTARQRIDGIIHDMRAKGAAVKNEDIGNMAKGILVTRLAEHERITHRELGPLLTMGLQAGGIIGQQRVAVEHMHKHAHLHAHANIEMPEVVQMAVANRVAERLRERQASNELVIEGEIVGPPELCAVNPEREVLDAVTVPQE